MRRLPGPLAFVAVVLAVCGALVAPLPAGAAEGEMTWAVHTSPGKAMGPRVEEAGLGLLGGYGFSAPYEDVKLKAR